MSEINEPAVSVELFLPLREARGVLFDMDGILLDTEPLYTVAYDRVLAPFEASLDRDTKLEIMGRKAIESAAHVIRKFGIELAPEEFLERRKPVLNELFADAPAIAQVQDCVALLKAQGKKLAVATSSSRDVFAIKTARHSFFSLFDEIVCGDDIEVKNPKPAPDIFQVAAGKLGLSAAECAVFEDSPSGVIAGLAAGAATYAFVADSNEDPRFAPGARFFRSFAEVLTALE